MQEGSATVEPRRVGRYVLEELLGEGGMGAVYRALDPLLHRRVALKLLSPNPSHDVDTRAEWSARMLREARAAASFSHPNVVAVYDVGIDDGSPYIAMELVEGRTLRSAIGSPEAPLAQRVRWLVEIARALAAAHRAGIVHRDVKPENVLIGADRTVKVLDFGIARRTSLETVAATPLPTLTAQGMILGTPQYMSPEQIRSESLDGRADQFAWGVVAFELLTGRSLWGATSTEPLRLVASILTSVAPPASHVAPGVPQAVSAVIARAVAKKSQDRFPDMDAAADALEAAVPSATSRDLPTARRNQRSAPTAPGKRPRAIGVLAVSAIALAAGGAVGVLSFARRDGAPAPTATRAMTVTTRSLAVLPFDNVTGKAEDDWLRLGLADALQTKMSNVPGLRVLSQPAGAPAMDLPMAKKLGAGWVVVGSFEKVGDRIRIGARVDSVAEPGRTLISTEQRGAVNDLFDLQDAVALALTAKLDVGASPSSHPDTAGGTRNVEALEALATGRALLAAGRVVEAMRAFDRAVRADPEYRAARANLNRVRAESHYFAVNADDTVVETISEVVRGDPDAPWELTTDSGTLTRAWDLDGNVLRVDRVAASGNQATFEVAIGSRESERLRGIVYELESSSKNATRDGLSVVFHAVAKNASGDSTFIVELPRDASALAVVPTPAETHEHDGGTTLVLHETRSAFVPYAWSVVHAADPAVVERFRAARPAQRADWIANVDPRMAHHGWASDLARSADVRRSCAFAASGDVAKARGELARMQAAPTEYGAFFLARAQFCVAEAARDDRSAASALEAAVTAPDRPAQLIPEAYSDAIDWCLQRQRIDDMARLVRLERRDAPWWNDGPFHPQLAPGDEERPLRDILDREPNNVAATYDLSLVLYRAKRYDEAAKALDGADRFLGGVYVSDLRARIAIARGQPADAAAELRKVVVHYPMTWAWIAHAVLLASAGRAEEAFAFVADQAPKTGYEPPLFWALRYVVGVLPHASRFGGRIAAIVSRAKETQYGEPYRIDRMIDLIEVASLSMDDDGPRLAHDLFERLKAMVRDLRPEACDQACLRRIGAHLCRVRGLTPAQVTWVAQTCDAACD